MAIVLIVKHKDQSSTLNLKNRTFTFGRSSKSDITIPDTMISGQHCSVTLTDNKVITVKDLGSTNGTFINGSQQESSKLFIGDVVTLGETSIRLDKKSLNPGERSHFSNNERTTVRYIQAPKAQDTLSIKRNIHEEYAENTKSKVKKASKVEKILAEEEKSIEINFNPDGTHISEIQKGIPKEDEVDADVDTGIIKESELSPSEDIDNSNYISTGDTQFIKLDKDGLSSKKGKKKKSGTTRKKKHKKKKEKPKSLFGKLFSIFK